MSWIAPVWLAGLVGAVALPLLAHILTRKGGRLAVFPTVRFLEKAAADIAHVARPKNWLLLLLRIMALAMIALAFARPVWTSQTPVPVGQGVALVIVVDRSASMNRTSGGATLFKDAKRLANDMLNQLDPLIDRAAVVFADASPTSILPEMTGNLSALQEIVAAETPTYEVGRLDAAVSVAAELVQTMPELKPGIMLITDAQASQPILPPVDISINVETLGASQPNVAIANPTLIPTHPVVGQPATLMVDLTNYGNKPSTVTAAFADEQQTYTLAPFATRSISWPVTFDQVGPQVVQIELVGQYDAMVADNTVGRVIDIADARQIVLVTRSNPADSTTAAWFVARAVAPQGETTAGVSLTVIDPGVFTEMDTSSDMPTVYLLVEAGGLTPSEITGLRKKLDGGDGVLWVVDSVEAAESLSLLTEHATDPPRDESQLKLGVGRFDQPVLAVFEGPSRSVLLDAAFNNWTSIMLGPSAEDLLTFETGESALAMRWHGAGRLAAFGVDLSPDSSDFVKEPAFVPLLQQLTRHLAPGKPAIPNPTPADILTADTPGLHTAANGSQVWIELDPAESDLRTVDLKSVTLGDAGEGAGLALRPETIELWPYLMLTALALLAAEGFTLWRIATPSVVEPGHA